MQVKKNILKYNINMFDKLILALSATVIVSLISLIGVISFPLKKESLKNFLIYFVSFSAGALFGDVFFHLLPDIAEKGFNLSLSLAILSGIVASFAIEKIICWRHCHLPITRSHIHSFAYMNLFGDFIHNFIDGLTIGASYLISPIVGHATALAVIFHEIPQEIGDFGVLLHGGFEKNKALLVNFLTSLSAIVGVLVVFFVFAKFNQLNNFLIPFAAGNFIYIAGSDLIPELHKETELKKGMIQLLTFIFGLIVMYSLLLLE
jgi:zinc and cadmium transporter